LGLRMDAEEQVVLVAAVGTSSKRTELGGWAGSLELCRQPRKKAAKR